MFKIPDFLKCMKVQFSAMGGIMQNSVSKFLFIHGVHVTGPLILERDEFHVFLPKYMVSTGSGLQLTIIYELWGLPWKL